MSELLLLNYFSYCCSTIIEARNVFLMAPLILELQILLASNISESIEIKIILVQFRDIAQNKTTST